MKKIITIVVLLMFTISQTSWAGWLDNWFSQYTSSGPNYFEGQKRGHFTAGSFSARIPTSTTYLFNIEKPRIKGGCGGIDAFLGGFGFVNFDYLVQKFQRLIQAAPAVAFQIALNTLSSQLSTIIGDIEKIVNALNNIQLNECAILKPFTTIDLSKDNAEQQFVEAAKAALKTTGLTDLWSALREKGSEVQSKSGGVPPASEQIAGCSAGLRNAIEGANAGRGLIGYFANQNNYGELAPIIRGVIGDIVITMGGSNIVPTLVPTCVENANQLFNEGTVWKKGSPLSNCEKDSGSFYEKVHRHLRSIYFKALNKEGRLTAEQEQIIKTSPLPVYKFVRHAIGTGDLSILDSMADPIAKGLLYQAFLDIYRETQRVLQAIDAQAEKTNNNDPNKLCNVTHIKVEIEKLHKRAERVYNEASKVYQSAMMEKSHAVQIAHAYSNFEARLYQEIAERFSPSVADRTTRK